jgi:hypothetical protein
MFVRIVLFLSTAIMAVMYVTYYDYDSHLTRIISSVGAIFFFYDLRNKSASAHVPELDVVLAVGELIQFSLPLVALLIFLQKKIIFSPCRCHFYIRCSSGKSFALLSFIILSLNSDEI